MVKTDKTVNGLAISYEIEADGYSIYLGGRLWITQYGKYAKPIDMAKSLEENCLLQIEDVSRPCEEITTTGE